MTAVTGPRKVLVVRNDKLGDFTLALPVFSLLKRNMPELELTALVPEYTREIAELHAAVDRVLIDPGRNAPGGSWAALGRRLARECFDAVITLFSTTRIGAAVLLARIPRRLAPATKAAQLCYNDRLVQRRSRAEKPEYEYNLDLARHFLHRHSGRVRGELELERPVLALPAQRIAQRRAELVRRYGLEPGSRWIFVHPGSGGSANNLSLAQYVSLIGALRPARHHSVVVTAGPGEREKAHALARELHGVRVVVHESTGGLTDFVHVLATADLFVGGSTGPLHLAGALDVPTAGFYPRRATSSALRWQTLNTPERRLAFMPPRQARERDMSAIDLRHAVRAINERFASI